MPSAKSAKDVKDLVHKLCSVIKIPAMRPRCPGCYWAVHAGGKIYTCPMAGSCEKLRGRMT